MTWNRHNNLTLPAKKKVVYSFSNTYSIIQIALNTSALKKKNFYSFCFYKSVRNTNSKKLKRKAYCQVILGTGTQDRKGTLMKTWLTPHKSVKHSGSPALTLVPNLTN